MAGARARATEEAQVVKKGRKAAVPRKRKAAAAEANGGTGTGTGQPQVPAGHAARAVDVTLDGAVDSLRRLLSELVEQQLESVAGQLADVRRAVASGASPERVLGLVDDLLHRLGSVRFAAEPLDVVDPLIHAVVEERPAAGVPRGVIVEALRPGFRSARGLVLCKAAVAVSGG